jgi:2,4-didehydro-3-deoxy-L-rhamnonate hydrolase
MRIGPFGAEKPVARIDDDSYVDLSDAVPDFDEAFSALEGSIGFSPW